MYINKSRLYYVIVSLTMLIHNPTLEQQNIITLLNDYNVCVDAVAGSGKNYNIATYCTKICKFKYIITDI
jgi:hypothetical protein